MSRKGLSVTKLTRREGYNSYFESYAAFNIGKVKLLFSMYNPEKGNKTTVKIPAWFDVYEFIALTRLLASGEFQREAGIKLRKAKEKGEDLSEVTLFKSQGTGKSEKYPNGRRGYVLTMKMAKKDGYDWLLTIQEGPEKKNETTGGGYMEKAVSYMRFPVTTSDLVAMGAAVEIRYQAFETKMMSVYPEKMFGTVEVEDYDGSVIERGWNADGKKISRDIGIRK